jgi:hypothetical protein
VAGLVTAGAGLACVAAGVFFAIQASDASSQVDALAQAHGAWSPSYADVQASGKRDATLAAVAFGVGGAALATGGTLFVIGVRRGHDKVESVSMAASWRF